MGTFAKVKVYSVLSLVTAGLLFSQTVSADTTQTSALAEAEVVSRRGADLTMQRSTVNAMNAAMDIAVLNVPGAISNANNAYGDYKRSEIYDVEGDYNKILYQRMSTSLAATNPDTLYGKVSAADITKTTFSRLNPSFLYEGEAAKVAEQFEKKSGMKREEFLKHLGDATDNELSPDDPQLMDKMISRFEKFAAKIPNKEFRANLEKGVALIPQTARTGLVAKAIQKFSSLMSDSRKSKSDRAIAKADPATPSAPAAPVTPAEAAKAAEPAKEDVNRGLASAQIPKDNFFGLAKENEANDSLAKTFQAATDALDQEVSIFEQVSRRYRSVTHLVDKGTANKAL